jgi:hypothetical protein
VTLLLPCRFEAWDLDKDGYINVEEFAFTGHAKIESRSTRELFKKIDSDSKHERFKHFLILFWKRIHFVQRVMFASFKIYLYGSNKVTAFAGKLRLYKYIQNRYKLKIVCYGSDI